MDILNDLNKAQFNAATCSDGPAMIIAGPGTGKTKTLTARVYHLINSGHALPQEILVLTFTKKAASELYDRTKKLLPAHVTLPQISTFHALCQQVLSSSGKAPTKFIDDIARHHLIQKLSRPKSLQDLSARDLSLLISRAKNLPPQEIKDKAVARIVKDYNQALEKQNLCDFDDLLLQAYEFLKNSNAGPSWRYILIDEFQDTNLLQYEIIKLLTATHNLFVIGDPNQSIYGFRGASGTIFARFTADYPTAQTVNLTINYRSAPEVVALTNLIFSNASPLIAHRQTAGRVRSVEVLNEYSEAQWILDEIQNSVGGSDFLRAVSDDDHRAHRSLSDFAILYRSRSAVSKLFHLVAESGLPYQIVGEGSPYEQPAVQMIIDRMRALDNNELPVKAAEEVIRALNLELTPELKQFLTVLVRFTNVAAALKYIDKIAEDNFYDPRSEAITLLTIHASKGLEFPIVFLAGAEEGILPHVRAELPEERRLFYVATSRARDRLEIIHTLKRAGQVATPTSLIKNLPPIILPRYVDPQIPAQVERIKKRALKRSQQSLF